MAINHLFTKKKLNTNGVVRKKRKEYRGEWSIENKRRGKK